MSKLIKIFRREPGTASQPMGFHTTRETIASKTLVLLVTAKPETAGPLEGADAILVQPGKTHLTAKTAQAISKAMGDIPWGINDSGEKPSDAPKGCDFVLFPATARIDAAPPEDEAGRVLEIDASMDDGLLRAVNDLPIDAVAVVDATGEAGPIVWHRLMILRHIVNLINKPLITTVSPDISPEDLKSIWEAGFDGIIVEADAAAVAKLSETISKLPPRSAPKQHRNEALLPRIGGKDAPEPEAEPDEEEWE